MQQQPVLIESPSLSPVLVDIVADWQTSRKCHHIDDIPFGALSGLQPSLVLCDVGRDAAVLWCGRRGDVNRNHHRIVSLSSSASVVTKLCARDQSVSLCLHCESAGNFGLVSRELAVIYRVASITQWPEVSRNPAVNGVIEREGHVSPDA
ncbi:hypothetical protein BaRGS_00000670 [Batillaria attramentaria]|uniref:Uncharacterized protein n=1 Tax=Batillaria attramentaria TaxID=370345 RepID=A0ABD0MAV4_9CAEN